LWIAGATPSDSCDEHGAESGAEDDERDVEGSDSTDAVGDKKKKGGWKRALGR